MPQKTALSGPHFNRVLHILCPLFCLGGRCGLRIERGRAYALRGSSEKPGDRERETLAQLQKESITHRWQFVRLGAELGQPRPTEREREEVEGVLV